MGRVIDALVLDRDGVTCPRGAKEFPAAVAHAYGLAPAFVESIYGASWQKDLYKRGSLTDSQFWCWFIEQLGIDVRARDLFRIMEDCYVLDERLMQWASELREDGLVLATCTNSYPVRDELLEKKFRFSEQFDFFIPSYEARSVKPERKIFKHVTDVMGIPSSRILFVDNDSDTIAVAKRLGFHAAVYEGLESLQYAYEALE